MAWARRASRSRSPPRWCRASPTVRGSASWPRSTTATRWPRSSRRRSGVACSPGLSLAESIVEYLKVRELLLVLDNCEHLLDEAGEFADAVVRRCPNVRWSRRAARRWTWPASASCACVTSDARRRPRAAASWSRARRCACSPTARRTRAPRRLGRQAVGGRGRDLPAGRRDPAGDRAGRGADDVDEPGRGRRAPRRAVPAPHRQAPRPSGTPPDAAGDGRMVLPAPRRRRTSGLRSARRVRRHLRRGGRERGRGRGRPRRLGGHRCALEPGREVDARSPRPGPTARPATRCSRRCASSPANGSTRQATPIGGGAPREHYAAVAHEAGSGLVGPDHVFWINAVASRTRQHPRRGRLGARLRRPAEQPLALQILASPMTGAWRVPTWASARSPGRPSTSPGLHRRSCACPS